MEIMICSAEDYNRSLLDQAKQEIVIDKVFEALWIDLSKKIEGIRKRIPEGTIEQL